MAHRVWVPDEKEVFVQAFVVDEGAKKYKLVSNNSIITLTDAQAKGLTEVDDDQLMGIPDVVGLRRITQEGVLQTLRDRFMKTHVYTFVDQIIISVNPFQRLMLETAEHLDRYQKTLDVRSLPPHVYSIARNAMMGLTDRKNQAILISGESGAGKTEACKIALDFFADAGGAGKKDKTKSKEDPHEATIQDKIIQCNPLLEAFGNAKTVRNNNSSRFGKWTAIFFDSGSQRILSAQVVDYLLEKSRIVACNAGERCYHIYYMLLFSKLSHYELEGAYSSYEALKGGSEKSDGFNDHDEFQEVLRACKDCGISDETRELLFSSVAAVLLMTNMQFADAGNDSSKIKSTDLLGKICKLLGCDAAVFEKACCTKKLVVGKDVTVKSLKHTEAATSCRSLTILLYARLFRWLVQTLNESMKMSVSVPESQMLEIGLLDIAGFESFKFNTWEQITINLSNEKLQQHFNNCVFKRELADYEAEGISAVDIKFDDNEPILETIRKIFDQLDTVTSGVRPSDQTFINNTGNVMEKEKNPYYTKDRFNKPKFTLLHYAGKVEYDVEGWVIEKNKNEPPKEATDLMCASSNAIIKEIGDAIAAEPVNAKRTVAKVFQQQLNDLITKINSAEPHFIRCVKPNDEKVPLVFTAPKVLEQLIFSGAMEAVKIRQSGFPLRIPWEDFSSKYRCIMSAKTIKEIEATAGKLLGTREGVETCVKRLPVILGDKSLDGQYQVGRTKLFCKKKGHEALDEAARFAKTAKAITIQAHFRGSQARRKVKNARQLRQDMRVWYDKWPLYTGPGTTGLDLMKTVDVMREESKAFNDFMARSEHVTPRNLTKAIVEAGEKLQKETNVMECLPELEATLDVVMLQNAVSDLLGLKIEGPTTKMLQARCAKLTVQTPIINVLKKFPPGSINSVESYQEGKKVLDMVAAANLAGSGSGWLDQPSYTAFTGLQKEVQEKYSQYDEAAASKKGEENAVRDHEMEACKKKIAEAEKEGRTQDVELLNKKMRRLQVGNLTRECETLATRIDRAVFEFDFAQLENCFEEGNNMVGMDSDVLAACQKQIGNLYDVDFVQSALQKAKGEMKKAADNSQEDQAIFYMTQVANLLRAATHTGSLATTVVEAEDAALKKFKIKMGVVLGAGISKDGEATQKERMAIKMFGDWSTAPCVNKEFVRAVHGDGKVIKPMDKNGACSWSRHRLSGTLTNVPAGPLAEVAKSAFRNILGWCTDQPVEEKRRAPLAYAVVYKAKTEPKLQDEMFCQIMKQCNHNPNYRSLTLAWKLMLFVSTHASPTPAFMEYVRTFVIIHKHRYEAEAAHTTGLHQKGALELLSAIEKVAEQLQARAAAAAKQLIAEGKDESAPKKRIEIWSFVTWDVQNQKPVTKPNGKVLTPIVMNIPAGMTVADLNKRASELHSVSSEIHEFSLFALDASCTHHIEPAHAKVHSIPQEKFFWSRRAIKPKEKIIAEDPHHANLVIKQCCQSWSSYVIPEDETILINVSAGVAASWWGEDAKSKLESLSDEDLKMIVPGKFIPKMSLADWQSKILAQYGTCFAGIDNLQAYSKAMKQFQQLSAFGSRQCEAVKSNTHPSHLNHSHWAGASELQMPDAEQIIGFSLSGLSFYDKTTGKEMARFGFSAAHSYQVAEWWGEGKSLELGLKCGEKTVSLALIVDDADRWVHVINLLATEEYAEEGDRAAGKKKKKKEKS